MLIILPVAIPGGGVGIFNACTDEWNAPSSGWGAQYGGISSNTCSTFPKALQAGCGFRFDWFEGADNPEVEFERVECPAEIVAKSGCKRDDDGAQKAVEAPASSKAPVVASSSSAAAQEATVASSSSVEAASSAYSTSESAPIATSVEAVASSAEAYTAPVESSAEAYTTSTPESSAAYTSAPAMASSPSSSSPAAATSSAITPSSSATSSEDAACNVQYVYEYDL
jgi:hypothetical protein